MALGYAGSRPKRADTTALTLIGVPGIGKAAVWESVQRVKDDPDLIMATGTVAAVWGGWRSGAWRDGRHRPAFHSDWRARQARSCTKP
jgi:hypothetical protein